MTRIEPDKKCEECGNEMQNKWDNFVCDDCGRTVCDNCFYGIHPKKSFMYICWDCFNLLPEKDKKGAKR